MTGATNMLFFTDILWDQSEKAADFDSFWDYRSGKTERGTGGGCHRVLSLSFSFSSLPPTPTPPPPLPLFTPPLSSASFFSCSLSKIAASLATVTCYLGRRVTLTALRSVPLRTSGTQLHTLLAPPLFPETACQRASCAADNRVKPSEFFLTTCIIIIRQQC
jgi:hypothetical protein